jgi:transcription elongation factor Elf1
MFSAFLGLPSDWHVSGLGEDRTTGLLEVSVESKSHGQLTCPVCNESNAIADIKNYRRLVSNKLNVRFFVKVNALQISCKICGYSYMIDPLVHKNAL